MTDRPARDSDYTLNRREVLKAIGLGTAGVLLGVPLLSPDALATDDNPVVIENQKPGSEGWRIGRDGHQRADDVSKQIKGFASRTSVKVAPQGRVVEGWG